MSNILSMILIFFTLSAAAGTPIKIQIVTPDNRARLCPVPACDQSKEILRIKTDTLLSVASTKEIKHGILKSKWYKVSHNGKTGWVSEYDIVLVK